MTDNVTSLRGDPVIQRKPNPAVVELFEDMLEAARPGEIIGFIGAIIDSDGCSLIRRAGIATRGLLGALTIAQHRLIRDFEAEE